MTGKFPLKPRPESYTINVRSDQGRTCPTPIHGTNRWWDGLEKMDRQEWPLVITFITKADRLAFCRWLADRD